MKNYLFATVTASLLVFAAAGRAPGQSFSDIEGKWTLNKTSGRYGESTQTIEFKDHKFTYQVISKDGDTRVFAKGTAETGKLGPFSTIKLTDIEGGDSEQNLDPTHDDRTLIYMKGSDTLKVASNFDAHRDGEETECDTYTKVVKAETPDAKAPGAGH